MCGFPVGHTQTVRLVVSLNVYYRSFKDRQSWPQYT